MGGVVVGGDGLELLTCRTVDLGRDDVLGRDGAPVAEREGVDIETARIDASAVMRVLGEAVTPG